MNIITEDKFVTGDGTVIYIAPASHLEQYKKIGWREATKEEVRIYFTKIAKRNEENTELFKRGRNEQVKDRMD